MSPERIKRLLRRVERGRLSSHDAFRELRELPFEDLGFARLDHHRELRSGIPEVIFCKGKSISQVATIFSRLAKKRGAVLATRATRGIFSQLSADFPQAVFHEQAGIITLSSNGKLTVNGRMVEKKSTVRGKVLLLSAGTSDAKVVEEARVTLTFLGVPVKALYDVGVAGIHRLLRYKKALLAADVVIVVAGMEGALPSVVGGLVAQPVIAVPTSVGYGANFRGLSALLGMMSSCVPGLAVVNIDNGFGAAVLAYKILKCQKT